MFLVYTRHNGGPVDKVNKVKFFPLQARCGPEGG